VVDRVLRAGLLLALTLTALSLAAIPAGAAPLGEVRLIPSTLLASGLAAGPEGEMWVTAGESTARVTTGEPTVLTLLNTSQLPAGAIVAGSDGNMWFVRAGAGTEIGRLSPAGEITEFNAGATHRPRRMTLGPDGSVWYTAGISGAKKLGEEYESSAIGRITPAGQVSEFTAGLSSKPLLGQITTGPDGDLWFVNDGSPYSIGRVTPAGEITEFPFVSKPWLRPNGITAGADGNVFFGASGENEGEETESVIGEITPSGEMKLVSRLSASEVTELATGQEGSVWFTGKPTEVGKPYVIGRLTPADHLEEELATFGTETEAALITPAPDGNMWFVTESKGGRRVGVIGTGAPAASQAPPTANGGNLAHLAEGQLSCDGAAWSTWAGQQPSVSAHPFDGYTWMLDGQPIAGQHAQTLALASDDAGQQISCSVTATYPLLNVSVSAASAGVLIVPAPQIPPAMIPVPTSSIELPRQTDAVTAHGALRLTLDCMGAPCSGAIKLLFKVKVTTGKGRHRRTSTVTVTIAGGKLAIPVGVEKVQLKLTTRGLGLLKRHDYKLPAKVSVSYLSDGNTHVSATETVELKGARPKPRHG
jgi:streptogramin lyase